MSMCTAVILAVVLAVVLVLFAYISADFVERQFVPREYAFGVSARRAIYEDAEDEIVVVEIIGEY